MSKISLSILFISLLLLSCEEQMIPIPDRPISADGRIMLIEDITGVSCVPCHLANVLTNQLLKETNGSVIVYGIHNGTQSTPHSDSKYDFRYPDVVELESTIDYIGQPAGMFNRVMQSNGRIAQSGSSTWQPFIDAELAKPLELEIQMEADFRTDSRTVDIEVVVTPVQDIPGELNLHLVITESHLIDPQATPDGVVEDYEHNHVMKESLTGLPGDVLVTNGLTAFQDTDPKNYTYTLPEESNGEWIAENIEIIAFVTSKERNNEVQQAFQIQLIE